MDRQTLVATLKAIHQDHLAEETEEVSVTEPQDIQAVIDELKALPINYAALEAEGQRLADGWRPFDKLRAIGVFLSSWFHLPGKGSALRGRAGHLWRSAAARKQRAIDAGVNWCEFVRSFTQAHIEACGRFEGSLSYCQSRLGLARQMLSNPIPAPLVFPLISVSYPQLLLKNVGAVYPLDRNSAKDAVKDLLGG